ncbi:MAG TPA: hypothetical protein VHI93_04105 [Candidatus Thermoplasmatota archaeon]|nr:hypothetical protein [Candidatus Thermoplasmatota archaeon]
MEQRKAIGLAIIAGAAILMLGGVGAMAGGAEDVAEVLMGVAWVFLNPLALGIVLFLMFRRPGGQQQQQQVVIHVAAGHPAPSVQVRCTGCNCLNAATSRFCAQCGKPTAAPRVSTKPPAPR